MAGHALHVGTVRVMARSSRTFTLKLSSAGVELFLDCHHRLCQQTDELLPYGQTLYCALLHLSRVDGALILDDLLTLKRLGLLGDKPRFVGAPLRLLDVVERIASKIAAEFPANRKPIVATQLYLVALKRFRRATPDEILGSYGQMIAEVGEVIKIRGRRRLPAIS